MFQKIFLFYAFVFCKRIVFSCQKTPAVFLLKRQVPVFFKVLESNKNAKVAKPTVKALADKPGIARKKAHFNFWMVFADFFKGLRNTSN